MNKLTQILRGSFLVFSLFAATSSLQAQEKLDIIATIPDLGNLVEEIGGERVNVEVLVKPGADPHSVLPKASMLLKLSRADGLVLMGIDYEHAFLPAMLEKCRNDAIAPGKAGYMNVGARIKPLEVPKSLDRGQGADLHPRGNPHYNMNPENGRIMAAAVRDLLLGIDPGSAALYQKRWQDWDKRAQKKIAEWKTLMEPLRGKKVVVYHNSWPYFAQFFGLDVVAMVEPKPGIAPSAKHLVKVRQLMRAQQIEVLIMEPWFNVGSVQSLKGDGVKVLRLPTASGITKESKTYLGWIDSIVRELRQGFGIKEVVEE